MANIPRKLTGFSLLLLALLVPACVSTPYIGQLSSEAARREAHHDIHSGHLKIYVAGGRAATEVGVSEYERPLVAGLPRSQRLSHGCTDPHVSEAMAYAGVYNREIVRFLAEHRAQ